MLIEHFHEKRGRTNFYSSEHNHYSGLIWIGKTRCIYLPSRMRGYDCIQSNCLYSLECPRQFEIPMDQYPALLGVFPAHTRCGRFLLSLRGLIEPEFGVQTLWSKLKRLPFRRLLNFKILAQLMDTATMLRKTVNANA